MHWLAYSSDLTEGEKWGGKARHGRASWRLHRGRREDDRDQELVRFSAEWAFFWPSSTSASITADPSEWQWQLHLGVYRLFSVWFSVAARWLPQPKTKGYDARTLSVSCHDGSIFWEVWKDPHAWSRSDGWRNSSWHWTDWLLGKPNYASTVVAVHQDVPVPMPEGVYRCRVELTDNHWTRKRGWGMFDKQVFRAEVTPNRRPDGTPGYIPHPGKWDREDGLFGITCEARTVADAVAATVRSVLRERLKRGGQLTYTPLEADT